MPSLASAAAALTSLGLLGDALNPTETRLQKKKTRLLFATAFATSVALPTLVLAEVLELSPRHELRRLWALALAIHLLLLIAVLPLAQLLYAARLLTSCSDATATRAAPPLFTLWLYAFYRLGDPFPVVRSAAGVVELCLSRAGLIGVTLMALMSGVGAVLAPFELLLRRLRPVDGPQLREAERHVLRTLHTLLQAERNLGGLRAERDMRREQVSARAEAAATDAAAALDDAATDAGSAAGSFFSRIASACRLHVQESRSSSTLRSAGAEVAALRNALRQCAGSLRALQRRREAQARAASVRGMLEDTLAALFGAYGVQKVTMAMRALAFPQAMLSTREPMLFRLVAAAGYLVPAEDVAAYSQALSLTLVGILIFSSTRGFIRQASSISARIGRSARSGGGGNPNGPSLSDLIGCAFAHVMGFYFFSSVLLVRTSLPHKYRVGISEAVGELGFAFYHHWFDAIFLAAASLTTATLLMRSAADAQRQRAGSAAALHGDAMRLKHAALAARARAGPAVHGSSHGSFHGAPGATVTAAGMRQRRSVEPTPPASPKSSAVSRTPPASPQPFASSGDAVASTLAEASAAASRGTQPLLDLVYMLMESRHVTP